MEASSFDRLSSWVSIRVYPPSSTYILTDNYLVYNREGRIIACNHQGQELYTLLGAVVCLPFGGDKHDDQVGDEVVVDGGYNTAYTLNLNTKVFTPCMNQGCIGHRGALGYIPLPELGKIGLALSISKASCKDHTYNGLFEIEGVRGLLLAKKRWIPLPPNMQKKKDPLLSESLFLCDRAIFLHSQLRPDISSIQDEEEIIRRHEAEVQSSLTVLHHGVRHTWNHVIDWQARVKGSGLVLLLTLKDRVELYSKGS